LLASLFSMDHMVTRMRRNSENLLLLGGHEGARKWSDPVSLADVVRAATSEIEHYSRVVFSIQPGIAVMGPAVSDVVHLLAELIENATLYSPTDTTIQVSGHEVASGGVLMEITDKGIGIAEERLVEMNYRLRSTPVIDVSVSRHMGLFAVARLAQRHNVQVMLRPASPQGLTALVWLPDSVVERTALPLTGRRARPTGQVGAGQVGAGQVGAGQVGAGVGGGLPVREPGSTRSAADGPLGNGRQDAGGDLVRAGQPREDWFHRRDPAPGNGSAGADQGGQAAHGLPGRVPGGSRRAPGEQRPGEGPAAGDA
jgi:hypothetical protein